MSPTWIAIFILFITAWLAIGLAVISARTSERI